MYSTHPKPSLLLFGPQTNLPPPNVLSSLRDELVKNQSLSSLVTAVKNLPQFWIELTEFDAELDKVPGARYLRELQHWVSHGGDFPLNPPNILLVPTTVILQITQYTRYITGLGEKNAHLQFLAGLQKGGIQGFCIGFLSAIIVAIARNEAEIGVIAAIVLRLSVCIGACVDKDGVLDGSSSRSAGIAVRWKEDNPRGREAKTV